MKMNSLKKFSICAFWKVFKQRSQSIKHFFKQRLTPMIPNQMEKKQCKTILLQNTSGSTIRLNFKSNTLFGIITKHNATINNDNRKTIYLKCCHQYSLDMPKVHNVHTYIIESCFQKSVLFFLRYTHFYFCLK